MNVQRILLAIVLLTLCGAAAASDRTWNGAADSPDWYAFSLVPDTEDPWVWVNNWSEEIYQYGGDPAPQQGSWDWPSGPDTATINIEGADLHSGSATLASLEIDLGGSILLRNTLQCVTLNTAGLVSMGRDGRVFQCAIQADGGTGVLRSVKEHWATVADPRLEDVIISVPVEIPSEMALGLLGNIQLNNIIQILAASDASALVIDGDVTLTGPGWVETNTSVDNKICRHYNVGQRLTNQVTIHAAGRIGCDTIAVTNEGLIVADRTNMLTINPADAPNDGQPPLVNTGTLRAAGGATMRLDNGGFENTGGVIEAQDGSAVELHDYAYVAGGTLQTSGTGSIRPSGTGSKVSDVTLGGGSALVIPDGRKLKIEGTVTVDGQVRLESTGNPTMLVVRSPVFLGGAGEIVLSDAAGNRFSHDGLDGGYRLTSAIPIRGATGPTSGLANHIAFTNQSTITADGVNPLLIDPINTANDGLAGFINMGTLRAVGGATMRLEDGDFDNTGGVVEAQDGSVVELHDAVRLTGGVLQTTGSGVIRSSTGYIPPLVSGLTVEGRLEALGGDELGLGGTIVNNGVIEADDYILPSGDLVLTGTGELRLVDGGQIRPDGDSVTNDADHTIRASGPTEGDIHHTLVHLGTLVVDSGASLRLHEGCNAQVGSSTRVDGTLTTDVQLQMAGGLTGTGTVNGAVNIGSTGVLSPGPSTGTLTTGNLTVSEGAAYLWQTSTATGSDLVDVNGELDLGEATLTVSIAVLGGDVPDRVVLFEYDTLASTPGVSQFQLTGVYTFLDVDTSGNELALTGVSYVEGLIFADSFETGDVDRWSQAVGSTLKQLLFDPPTHELDLRLSSPDWLVERAERFKLVDARDADGEPVVAVESWAGALRVGVRCSSGWNWSDWLSAAGSELELHWHGRQVWLYDDEGLLGSAEAIDDIPPLALLRAHSTREVVVQPTPARTH